MEENDRTRPPAEDDSAQPSEEPLDPVVGEPKHDEETDDEAERSREGSPRPE
jgi:hypothetical protein